jgi:hypothetical protein
MAGRLADMRLHVAPLPDRLRWGLHHAWHQQRLEALGAVISAVAGLLKPLGTLGQLGSVVAYALFAYVIILILRFVYHLWESPAKLAAEQFSSLETSYEKVSSERQALATENRRLKKEVDQLTSAPSLEFVTDVRPNDGDDTDSLVLGVTNLGPADQFQAQLNGWGLGESLRDTPPVALKWRGSDEPLQTIPTGMTAYLEIVRYGQRTANPSHNVEGVGVVAAEAVTWIDAYWTKGYGPLGQWVYGTKHVLETHIWSLRIVISSTGNRLPHRQGVRLHLFQRVEDDPTGKLALRTRHWKNWRGPRHPIARLSLFDLNQQRQRPNQSI